MDDPHGSMPPRGGNATQEPLPMTPADPVLFRDCQEESVHRIATIEAGDLSALESRWPVDSIELIVTSWASSASAYRRSREALMRASERYHRLPILVRVCACIDETVSQAARRFDTQVGRLSAEHLNNLWYVGTSTGLQNLLKDVAALQLCDGVVIRYLDSARDEQLGLELRRTRRISPHQLPPQSRRGEGCA